MTYQRPAYEQVTIAHGDHAVTLRPTLRAAVTLEQRFGMPALIKAIQEQNTEITSEIIRACVVKGADAAAFLKAMGRPLSPFFHDISRPLAELVSMFTPASRRSPEAPARIGKATPWSDFYADLYSAATGWLGWTPETAWNATPTEIDRAYLAHVEKLRAVYGGEVPKEEADPEQAERNLAAGLDPEFDRAGLHALKGRGRAT